MVRNTFLLVLVFLISLDLLEASPFRGRSWRNRFSWNQKKRPLWRKFHEIVVFGDSNADNGLELANELHGFKRSANGPVWPEYLGKMLRLPMQDWAYSGALSGQANYYFSVWSGVLWQIQKCDRLSKKTLVALQSSVNDLFIGADAETDQSATVLENNRLALEKLAQKGVEKIIFINVEDITLMPGFDQWYLSQKDVIKQRIIQINEDLVDMVAQFQKDFPSVKVVYVDLHKSWDSLAKDFPNKTDSFTYRQQGFTETEQFDYIWYDEWHLTTSFHKRIAEAVVEAMKQD